MLGWRQRIKSALQLLINRYGSIRFAHVRERVSTKSFVVLIRGILKLDRLGVQSTFNPSWLSSAERLPLL